MHDYLPPAPSAEPITDSSEDENLSKTRPKPQASGVATANDEGTDDARVGDEPRAEEEEESSEEYGEGMQDLIDEDFESEEQEMDDVRDAEDQERGPEDPTPVVTPGLPAASARIAVSKAPNVPALRTPAAATPASRTPAAKTPAPKTPTTKDAAAKTSAEPRASTSNIVLCVCGHSKRALRVGRCSRCNLLMHPTCRARTSKDLPGFLCFQCPESQLETFKLAGDIQYVATVDGQSAQAVDAAKPKKAEKQPQKVENTSEEHIVCKCPGRAGKLRQRLGRCLQCDRIVHISCSASKAFEKEPGFRCGACQEGLLEEIPDRIVGKTAAKKAAKAQLGYTQTERPQEVVEDSPAAKKRKIAHPTAVRSQQTPTRDQTFPLEIPDEESPKRHNLRQRSAPVLKDIPARSQRKESDKLDEISEISKQFKTIYNSLIRKAKKAEEEPRTSNVHDIFLRDIPLALLWRHYCLLPESTTTNAAVREATRVHFVDYRVEPITSIPGAWSEELKHRLRLLLDAAKADGQKVQLEERLWRRDAGMALGHLRDMAVEALHRGSLRKKGGRARLGLLGELLGLSGKGTFWKGKEEFGGT